MIRADQDRRNALAAVVNMGESDSAGAESFRMVIYLTGEQSEHATDIARCEQFAEAQHWRVIALRLDRDESQWAWMRMGLLSAVTMICHGKADGIAMPQAVFDELSSDDCSFLFNRLNRFGGFLRTVPDEDEAAR